PILTSCFLFAYVWQWTDSFYARIFLSEDFTLLPNSLTGLSGALDSYLQARGIAQKATVAYSQQMIATGTLMAIIPLILIYLFAQKGFVESLSQTGIKM
ncbi:MAG: carbohydrate ABC transporter permease, partial [Tyzzerella sp.]|nr:carbohydrate ABC transporter permease [Tyzzerella sp.]